MPNTNLCKIKMKVYCGANHEDVEHATKYKIVLKLMDEYKI
jgi:hypothetical protein